MNTAKRFLSYFTAALCFVLTAHLILPHPAHSAEKIYSLSDAYQSALAGNEAVKISEENVFQSASRVDQARTYLYPRIVGQGAYTRYNDTLPPGGGTGVFQPLSQYQAGLVARQPLYTGGRTLAGLRTTQRLEEISDKQLSSTKQDIILAVAAAYYGVLKAQKMVEKSRDSVDRMEHHKQVTEREAATRKTKANVSSLLRARTLVSQARITLTRDENNLRVARQRLNLLSKLPESASLSEPTPEQRPTESFENLKSLAFANRNDYAASKLNQQVAEENITIVKGAHYPQAYAEAALTYTNSSPETLLDGKTYYGGFRLEIPIFEGGLMKAELSEARSKRRQAELSSQYLERQIETEVFESYVNYQTVTSVLDAAAIQYRDAKSNFDAIQGLFAQGLVSSLALIDAQQALFLAEREFVNATYDQQVAILSLKRSVGLLGKTDTVLNGGKHAAS